MNTSGSHPSWSGRISRQELTANYDPDRFTAVFSEKAQDHIDLMWRERRAVALQRGVSLFNAPLIRLNKFQSGNNGALHIELDNTDYKQYIGTRSADFTGQRANPIGTCLIPITSDGFIPLGRRSLQAEVNAGKYFTFGGFLEADTDMRGGVPDLFACMQREMREETGLTISPDNLTLISIIEDVIHCHPEFSFISRLDVDSVMFRNMSWQNELNSLSFVAVEELPDFVARNSAEIVPTLRGALNICMESAIS